MSQIQIYTTEMNMDWDDLPVSSIGLLSCSAVCVRLWVRVYVHACLSLSCAPMIPISTKLSCIHFNTLTAKVPINLHVFFT